MAEAKWYVAHTYSGYENKVKADLEKTIENRHLEEEILEVRVPMQEVVEMKNGAKKTVQKKLFPGYVLVNMVMNDDTWYVVRNTRGVTGFVGPGSKPDGSGDEAARHPGRKRQHRFFRRRYDRRGGRRMERYHRRGTQDRLQQTVRYDQCRAVRQGYACRDQLFRSTEVTVGRICLQSQSRLVERSVKQWKQRPVTGCGRKRCAIPQYI